MTDQPFVSKPPAESRVIIRPADTGLRQRRLSPRQGLAMSLDTVKIPSLEQLREIAMELGFTFSDADLAAHR